MDFIYYLGLAITGFGAGLFGSLLGLGGGVFVVPAFTLIFGVPTSMAIGTSNVAVIATSTAGASTYVRNRLANVRLGLLLLTSMVFAAMASSLLVSVLPAQVLSGLFAIVMGYVAWTMLSSGRGQKSAQASKTRDQGSGNKDAASDNLGIGGSFTDAATGHVEVYEPQNVRAGVATGAIAGVIAGLLGVGGGIVNMPVMNLLMKVPLKAATGTSNFMIGVTGTSAALVRYAHGDINPLIVVPTVLCVFFGARLGAWLVPKMPVARLKSLFGWVAVIIALLMLLQALGLYRR